MAGETGFEFLLEKFTEGDENSDDKTEWVWRNRIPKGKVTLVSGPGGAGKTHGLASVFTSILLQEQLPDGEMPEEDPGQILIITTENTMQELRQIFRAQGCGHEEFQYLQRLPYVLKKGTKERYAFDIDKNLADLEKQIQTLKPIIVFFDPLLEFHSKREIDSHQIRGLMVTLNDLAERYHVAIIATIHWNKNDKQSRSNRTSGSHQYRDAVRSLIIVEPGDHEVVNFVQDKHNLGPKPVDLAYKIEPPDGAIVWVPPEFLPVNSKTVEAENWLIQYLTPNGPVAFKDLLGKSQIPERTLYRAKAQMKGSVFSIKKFVSYHYETFWDIRCERNNFGIGKLDIGDGG